VAIILGTDFFGVDLGWCCSWLDFYSMDLVDWGGSAYFDIIAQAAKNV
jgi:hypothetical protein